MAFEKLPTLALLYAASSPLPRICRDIVRGIFRKKILSSCFSSHSWFNLHSHKVNIARKPRSKYSRLFVPSLHLGQTENSPLFRPFCRHTRWDNAWSRKREISDFIFVPSNSKDNKIFCPYILSQHHSLSFARRLEGKKCSGVKL